MSYLVKHWGCVMKKEGIQYVIEYEKCCNRTENWLNMVIKYNIIKDDDILKRIIMDIPEVIKKEKDILEDFLLGNFSESEFINLYI